MLIRFYFVFVWMVMAVGAIAQPMLDDGTASGSAAQSVGSAPTEQPGKSADMAREILRPVDAKNATNETEPGKSAAQAREILRPVEAVSLGLWVGDSLDERNHPLLLEACFLKRDRLPDCVNASNFAEEGSRFLGQLEAASGVKWLKIETESAWSLRDVWENSNVDSIYWLMANPHLTRRAVPGRRTAVWVPEAEKDGIARAVSEAQQMHRMRLAEEPEEIVNYYSVQVKSGDCLSHIARRERVSVREIKAWNNLKSDRIYVGQRLLIGGWPTKSNKT